MKLNTEQKHRLKVAIIGLIIVSILLFILFVYPLQFFTILVFSFLSITLITFILRLFEYVMAG